MAFFALLWKARTIEKYRLNYEKEKINSIVMRNTQMEQTLSQRWRYYRYDTQKRISRTFKKWYPEGSGVANFFLYLSTDQTFPNFLLKSVMGFVGGIVLTYLCFMFFVFQLSISLIHATIMSSTIGVLLTLGLAFSYRIRCLVFLLIPQFFSRVGRYTLTCYALVLILTGPATNTLKNSEVLSESMACSQEQLKTSVHQLDDLMNKPYNSMKESITMMMDRFKAITMQVKLMIIRLNRLLFSIVGLTQSTFSWLQSISDMCNLKLSSPYDRCNNLLNTKFTGREKLLGPNVTKLLDMAHLAQTVCDTVKPYDVFCYATDFMDEGILASIRKKIRNFTSQLRTLFHVEMSFHHSYSFSSNSTKSASQVAAGIVTEIRNRADPLLTWLSWSSCVTSLFLLLIIFRAKYYQHMYETRSRFDNQYVTKELRELDLKRQRQGRETVLPLNRRERAKYITTTSFRLVASEKVYLTRSAVFMAITTFKLLIHMIADYSLYWVLMTIRHHGKYQSNLMPGVPQTGAYVTGDGFVARLFRSILDTLDLPLSRPAPSPIPCLPDPYPPDFRRYTQIGVLIFMLWFFALFEPYGLRLRHLIMGQYRPERAKARATWLYNHILRTRGGFMKFARRKLHREYKYYTDSSLTFSHWLDEHIPFQCLRYMLGIGSKEPQCLLCGTTTNPTDDDTRLTRCKTPNCPGVYCATCFSDIGQLCTICLSPADYGDQSDESLEKGSSDDSDSGSEFQGTVNAVGNIRLIERHNTDISATKNRNSVKRWKFFRRCFKTDPKDSEVSIPTDYEDLNMITDIKSKVNNHKRSAKEMLEKVPSSISFDYNNNQINNLAKLSEGIVCKTKSVGTNTDKRHQWFPKITFERFFTCLTIKIYKMHQNTPIKQNKAVLEQQLKNLRMDKANVTLDHNNRNVNKTRSNYSLPNPVIDSNEVNDDKIKTCKRDNGVTTTARRLQNSNQRNSTSNNKKDKSNKKSKKRKLEKIEPLDNSTPKENATNKRVTKNNQHKKSGKEKKKKVKMKTSRQKLNEYQTFFSRHWKSIKCNIGRTNRKTKSDSVILKEKKNHKRRKKWKDDISLAEVTPKESKCNNDNKKIRNYRISAFLADLDWMKKDFKKPSRQIIEDDTDDFSNLTKSKVCQMLPKHRNKIVAMMQFSNTPFQWGRPQELRYCKCYKQKCMESTYKVYQYKDSAKRALERFRHKVNSAIITPPSSMMHKMLSTMNLIKKPANKENNAANFPEQPEMSSSLERKIRKPGFIRTDVIYKNQDFLDELKMREANREDSDSSIQKIINPDATLLRTDCTLFHSISSERTENKVFFARGCKCEPFVDTQRKWTDVNKSVLPSTTKRPPPKKAQIQPKNMASKKRNTIVIKENDSNLLTRMRNYLSFSSCNNKSCQIKIERAKKAEKSKLYDEHMSNHDIPKPKAKQATTTKPKTNKEQTSKKDKDIDLCLDKCLSPKEPRPFNRSKCKEIEMAKIKEIQRHIDREREIKNEIIKEQERHKEREKQIERELGLELMRHRQHERHLLGDEDNQTLNSLAKCCDFTPKDTKSPPQQGQSQLPPSHQQPQQPLPYQPSMYQPPPQPPPAPPIKVRDCATQDSSSKMMRRKKEKNAGVGTGVTCMCDKKEGRDRRTSCTCATQYTPCMKISAATMPDKYIEKVISKCTRRHSPPITRIVSETSAHKAIDRKSPRVKHSGIQFQSSNIHNEHSPGIICPSNYRKEKTLFAKRTSNYKKEVTSTATCSPRIKDTSTLTNFLPKLDITSNPPLSSPVASPQDRGELESLISPSLIRLNMADTTTEQLMIPKVGTSGFAKVSSKKCQVEAKEKHKLSKDERKDKNRAENQTEHKAAHNFYWQKYGKKNKADTKPCPVRRRRLSLERSLFEICHQSDAILTSMQSESSTSTITSHSDDETRTDTTICSLATVEFEELRRRTRKKRFPNVVTRINQATSTDKARSRNVATETQDWWSPMVEKKGEIALNKKKGYYVCEKRRRDMRDFTEKGKTRDSGVTTEGRIVKFNSRTQVIPPGLLGYSNDIMSPARYLLESQKYYNELFAFNLRPPVADYAYYQAPRIQDKEKSRSAFGSRRAHQHKTKRLDECYTPRRQYSPRKRQTDSTRTSDSPRRRSNMYRKSMNRYYTKVNSGKRYYY